MDVAIIAIIIISIIFFGSRKYSKKKSVQENEEYTEDKKSPQFYCDRFSYTWNAISEVEENIVLTFEIHVKSPYDFTLTEYILFCGLSISKNYNFYNDEPRWGSGTFYGDWWPRDTKQIKRSVTIPKKDFQNTPQELYFNVAFKGPRELPVEEIARFELPVSSWHNIQKALAAGL